VDYAAASQANLGAAARSGISSEKKVAVASGKKATSPQPSATSPYAATHSAYENPIFETFDADVAQAAAAATMRTAAAATSDAAAAAAAVAARKGANVGGAGELDGAVELGAWSCVYLNDKVTASKAGRLILTETHVYFKTGDDTSLFNAVLIELVAVMPGDVLKAAHEGKTGMFAALSKLGSKLGDKLGIGSLVLKLVDGSHTFTTMPKRDEAGVAIANAANAGVVYTIPAANA